MIKWIIKWNISFSGYNKEDENNYINDCIDNIRINNKKNKMKEILVG